ncbi:RagB/SusD family nutrient uptake outer membrane protein [Maribellus comscasis]|uniref:RagB/SusD family nutrient uptake outer membrane protein n=1 Tax=Maribellus comscasis TaxID=2681766 RepID=A0A6I6JMH1_9BACT|nr:RagB/SusD family nutrient uptake outer membrane protein [Maribellus comscasis]QGY44116.1 RagB/SusD family nutrient uptake outer membrane protein [Maribellus comscasis]
MKIYKILILLIFSVAIFSCQDELDTNPTDSTSGDVLFSDVEKANVALNGIYRAMYVAEEWSANWADEEFGTMAFILTYDLMGEDMTQNEGGSGWFWYDYVYNVKSDYTHKSGRPYSVWFFYYTIISNANAIIASEEGMTGAPSEISSLIGQAYALRAYSYFNLIRFYQQTYVGNESAPGVPIYTEPTTNASEGKPRGTVADVYTQIDADIEQALQLLNPDVAASRNHPSHIDYYVANGIKANIALEKNDWSTAEAAADLAMSGGTSMLSLDDLDKGFAFNDVNAGTVLWGVQIISEQADATESFFGHMDASVDGNYAETARKCISSWLYNQMSDNDVRKNRWWHGPLEIDVEIGPELSYNQFKFQFSDPTNNLGDYIFMRHEEMMLVKAEAMCMQAKYSQARTVLEELMAERDPGYDISSLTDANTLTTDDSNGPTTPAGGSETLLDEIILQRRIELWGEVGRILDIKRLKTGFSRNFEGSNHPDRLLSRNTLDPEYPDFVMSIPQSEFDGNKSMDESTDQNPWADN